MSMVLKTFSRRILIAVVLFMALPTLPGSKASAEFCDETKIGEQRCRSAVDILRNILKGDDAIPQKKAEPAPATAKTGVESATDRPSRSVPERENASQSPAGVIYIPFPTPRPVYERRSFAPATTLHPYKEAAIDPLTTAGIFSKCLDVAKISEPDIKAQQRELNRKDYCITERKFIENGLKWHIFTIKNNAKPSGPLFVVPHDNEDAAFVTGVYGLRRYGGTLVAVEAGEERFLSGQDPNRNFGTNGAVARRCRGQRAPAPKYTRAILNARQKGAPIIALHSNANGWSGNGGKGNISIRRPGAGLPFVTALARSRRFLDEDTLVILAGANPPGKDRDLSRKIKYFTQSAGVNVLFEQVNPATNDCSLSNYVVLKNLGSYFNIEVETGDAATQKKILDLVMRAPR